MNVVTAIGMTMLGAAALLLGERRPDVRPALGAELQRGRGIGGRRQQDRDPRAGGGHRGGELGGHATGSDAAGRGHDGHLAQLAGVGHLADNG